MVLVMCVVFVVCGVGHSYVWSLLCVVLVIVMCGVCCVWCWS